MKYQRNFMQWNTTQRNGVLGLLTLIILLQWAYYWVDFPNKSAFSIEEFADFQIKIDSIERNQKQNLPTIFPFNPNFLTDYRAYQLGISAQELERLYDFRKKGKFVNSAQEFQKVTQISDSLFKNISPYFKFPDWVSNISNKNHQKIKNTTNFAPQKMLKADINTASQEDLEKIYGIGPVLSQRIIDYRERLQGFSLEEQLSEVYGLKNEVIHRIWERFEIKIPPKIVKIDINFASKSELAQIPYINFKQAEEIILYRSQVGIIKVLEELLQINTFDEAKINKIKLYLYAQNSK